MNDDNHYPHEWNVLKRTRPCIWQHTVEKATSGVVNLLFSSSILRPYL